jgi:hypothetical protein
MSSFESVKVSTLAPGGYWTSHPAKTLLRKIVFIFFEIALNSKQEKSKFSLIKVLQTLRECRAGEPGRSVR